MVCWRVQVQVLMGTKIYLSNIYIYIYIYIMSCNIQHNLGFPLEFSIATFKFPFSFKHILSHMNYLLVKAPYFMSSSIGDSILECAYALKCWIQQKKIDSWFHLLFGHLLICAPSVFYVGGWFPYDFTLIWHTGCPG